MMKIYLLACLQLFAGSSLVAQMELQPKPASEDGVEAITDAKKFFDSAETFIGFDDLEKSVRINEKLEDQGVKFSSSNADDSVITVFYSFSNGKSKKMSIASAKPLFQGKMTITLTKKNVVSVGFNLSHTNKGGTIVDAFSDDDKFLGRFGIPESPKRGTAFFGMKSDKPIGKLVISPVIDVDEDFALDDLAFSTKSD